MVSIFSPDWRNELLRDLQTSGSLGQSGSQFGFRNKVINGNFVIAQRAESSSGAGYTSVDRWRNVPSPGGVVTLSRLRLSGTASEAALPKEAKYYLRVDKTVEPSSSVSYIEQRIESVHTLAGKRATATIWARGTSFQLDVYQVYGTGGPVSGAVRYLRETIPSSGNFTKYSFAFDLPDLTGKTLGTNNDDYVLFRLLFPTGQLGFFDLANVSLVEGDATQEIDPFSQRHIQQELALCHRYYWRGLPAQALNYSAYAAGAWATWPVQFPVTMRTSPSLAINAAGATLNNSTAPIVSLATVNGCRLSVQSTAATTLASVTFTSDNFIAADAEL